MFDKIGSLELEAMAAEEARRLYETEFSFNNPYTRTIETAGVPEDQKEAFCKFVEEELAWRGEKINRKGEYFKIERYQRR